MTKIIHCLIDVGLMVGTVDGIHYYSKDFMTIDGTTKDGKKFSITLRVEEEEKNGN